MSGKKELELYIHIPFCVKKCSYCDFLSMPAGEDVRRAYVDRLLEEVRQQAGSCRDYQVVSVFVGGGTPSLLAGVQIWEIMEQVYRCFQVMQGAEITLECNPGTLNEEKLTFYKSAGINRLSLGLQSADDMELKELGRIHSYADFLQSFDLARKKGFGNINVDLISSLPGQTPQGWENTLKKVLRLMPEHISAYSLIIEEGTPFYERFWEDELRREQGEDPRFLPTEEAEREMYVRTLELLESRGYQRYEISNYALPHKECRHNIGYWQLSPYLGLGLGSSSFMEDARFSSTRNLNDYLDGMFCSLPEIFAGTEKKPQDAANREGAEVFYLGKKQQMEEFMFLGLRMTAGIERSRFEEKFSVILESVYGPAIRKLQQQGLLAQREGRIFLTEQGIAVSNYVFGEFLL
ncbi:MAG: oxygen-independent coproporphyrinogen III oxidase [Lachnospiraceae bacterium]|nr:oxygen-independent coproporphyrinogen III oxidase [Lachnospiraceae bacterium]